MTANVSLPDTVMEWPAKYNEIPKAVFEEPGLWRLELENIFYGEEWHPIVHRAEIPNPGDYKAAFIGEMPIFAVHGDDGKIRVFHNACAHRGAALVTDSAGNKADFECPYHRWLFSREGALVGCPNSQDFSPSFTKEKFGLKELRTESFAELYFVTMSDKTPDLRTYMTEAVADPLSRVLGNGHSLKLLGYQKVHYDCNWKAYVDNDGYHAPLLHLAFKLMGWQGGKGVQIITDNGHIAFDSELTIPGKIDALEDSSIVQFKGDPDSKGSIVVSTFPITVFTKHMDMLNIRYAFPKGPRGVEVHYTYFARDDDSLELLAHRTRQSANLLGPSGLISLEDAAIFTRIDMGNRSPGNAIFQKGVTDEYKLEFNVKQNDESGNLPRWEHYRKRMGFPEGQGMNGIDSKVRDAIERLNLTYIRALDRRDMHGWLATFDKPGSYVCIAKENEDRGLPIGYMLDDCYERLQDRVTQVTKIQPDAVEHYQPRHFTQLVDIKHLGGVNYRVETHFTVNYTPADTGRTDVLATGTYVDDVVVNGDARFRSRRAVLDTNVVPRYVAYPI